MTDKTNYNCELGMNCPITRRDFLNGVAIGVGGVLAAPHLASALDAPAFAPENAPDYYPPALMGMRGNHDGTSPSRTNSVTTSLRPVHPARNRPRFESARSVPDAF